MAEHPISRTDPTLDPGGPDAFLAALSTRNQQLYLKTVGVIKEPAFRKSVEKTTKLFKAIESAGKVAGRMIAGMPMTRGLVGMPGQIAATGLDALGAQLIAPLTAAVSAGMGTLMAGLNEALGPALAKIGQGMGVVAKGGEQGTGIGGGIGSMIGGAIGSAYGPLGKAIGSLGGALLGGGIEMLFNRPKKSVEELIVDFYTNFKARADAGESIESLWAEWMKMSGISKGNDRKAIDMIGLHRAEDLATWLGVAYKPEDTGDVLRGGGTRGGGSLGGRTFIAGGITGDITGDVLGGGTDGIIRELQAMRRDNRRAWG